MGVTAKKSRVRILATHRNPDIDDVEAIRLLREYGEKLYPGIKASKVMTSSNRTPYNESVEELEAQGILCVGIGGSIFDEHAFEGRDQQEKDCATTLVAKHLGIHDIPHLQKNIGYALEKNYSALTDHWEIAPLVKLAFRYGDGSSEWTRMVFEAAFLFLSVAERNEQFRKSGKAAPGEVKTSMDEIVAVWLVSKFGGKNYPLRIEKWREEAARNHKSVTWVVARELGKSDDETLRFVVKYGSTNKAADCTTETDFRLAQLVCIAQKHLCFGEKTFDELGRICKAADIFLTAMWRKDTNFVVECAADHNRPTTRHEFLRGNGKTLRITSVVSENPEIMKYCRAKAGGNAAVVIKRTRAGNTQVFFDQSQKLDPKPIVAALRTAERAANGVTAKLTEAALTAKGSAVEGAEAWYFDGFQIMNGSLTTDVAPTKLTREQVDAIVLKALARSIKAERV